MNKLQLHEIAGYLPYGLPIQILNHKCDYVGIEFSKVNGHYFIGEMLHVTYERGSTGKDVGIFKPILRLMSDLNDSDLMKEWIKEHSIEKNIMGLQLATRDARCIDILGYPLQFINELYRNHFDIHNLIGRGLAIDINTLKD